MGASQEGGIHDKLQDLGVTHENYQIQPSQNENIIGRGAQNIIMPFRAISI